MRFSKSFKIFICALLVIISTISNVGGNIVLGAETEDRYHGEGSNKVDRANGAGIGNPAVFSERYWKAKTDAILATMDSSGANTDQAVSLGSYNSGKCSISASDFKIIQMMTGNGSASGSISGLLTNAFADGTNKWPELLGQEKGKYKSGNQTKKCKFLTVSNNELFYSQVMTAGKKTSADDVVISPLCLLRFIQFYGIYQAEDKKRIIGGLPVQLDSDGKGLVGKRTIAKVYKLFTGLKWQDYKDKADKAINTTSGENGYNCKKNSIADKLYNGKLTFEEAWEQLRSNIVDKGTVRLFNAGGSLSEITYETATSMCFCSECSSESDPRNAKMCAHVIYHYLGMYGVKFNTPDEAANDANKETFFTSGGCFKLSKEDGKFVLDNMRADLNNAETKVITKLFNIIVNTYCPANNSHVGENSTKDLTGNNINKPLMSDVLLKVTTAMKNMMKNDKKAEVIQKYMTYDASLAESSVSSYGSEEVELSSLQKKIKKVSKSLSTLNPINGAVILKTFLDSATNKGNHANAEINMIYKQMIKFISDPAFTSNNMTIEQCFNLHYKLDQMNTILPKIKKTRNARKNPTMSSILKFCKEDQNTNTAGIQNPFSQVSEHYYNKTTQPDGSPYTVGLYDDDEAQRYSDYVLARTTIRCMGGIAYRLTANTDEAHGYSEFVDRYEAWLADKKTGLTTYNEGVQHQDGFIGYALSEDINSLKDNTKSYFSDSENALNGETAVAEGDGKKKFQRKVQKWEADTEAIKEEIEESFFVRLLNNVIYICGWCVVMLTFTLASLYIFDMISNNQFAVLKHITFGKIKYNPHQGVKSMLVRFVIAMGIGTFLILGDLVKSLIYFTVIISDLLHLMS